MVAPQPHSTTGLAVGFGDEYNPPHRLRIDTQNGKLCVSMTPCGAGKLPRLDDPNPVRPVRTCNWRTRVP